MEGSRYRLAAIEASSIMPASALLIDQPFNEISRWGERVSHEPTESQRDSPLV